MARMIDADRLLLELTALSHGQVWPGWTYDGIRLLIERQPTLTPSNEPLALEELREMSGQPFWDDASSGWWIVAHVDGSKIYTEEGAILDFYEEGEEDSYFRRPPEGEEE